MKIIGHRGAKGLAPENTLAGFEQAIRHGVDEIELDVRVTKDGIPALVHDTFVLDASGKKHEVATTNFNDLLVHNPNLTTLDAALASIDHRVPVVIEVKPGVPTERIAEIITMFLDQGWRTADLRIASFDQNILVTLHRQFPDVPVIVNERWSGAKATHRAKELNTRRLCMRSWWLWSGLLKSMHARGWQVTAYTVNDPKKVQKWEAYLYGIVTDYPDRFKQQQS